MNTEQAKKFFCDYNGYKFHMAREEPGLMTEYNRLKVPRETEEEWRQEILDKLENKYYAEYDKLGKHGWEAYGWLWFDDFLKVMEHTNTECEKNGERLLKMLEHAVKNLDRVQKILVMEDVPNVISWVCNHTGLKERLLSLINELINFDASFVWEDAFGRENMQARYEKALIRIARCAIQYSLIKKELKEE